MSNALIATLITTRAFSQNRAQPLIVNPATKQNSGIPQHSDYLTTIQKPRFSLPELILQLPALVAIIPPKKHMPHQNPGKIIKLKSLIFSLMINPA